MFWDSVVRDARGLVLTKVDGAPGADEPSARDLLLQVNNNSVLVGIKALN